MIKRERLGRALLVGTLAAAALLAAPLAMAQQYPDRPITIVHNYGPGTASDATARMIAEALSQQLGKSVIVDNRSGASGVVGTKAVAGSAPDGYTLMVGPMTAVTSQPHLVRDTGLGPDLIAPICNISANILGAAVRSDGPFTDGPSLVAAAKKAAARFRHGRSQLPHLPCRSQDEGVRRWGRVRADPLPQRRGGAGRASRRPARLRGTAGRQRHADVSRRHAAPDRRLCRAATSRISERADLPRAGHRCRPDELRRE